MLVLDTEIKKGPHRYPPRHVTGSRTRRRPRNSRPSGSVWSSWDVAFGRSSSLVGISVSKRCVGIHVLVRQIDECVDRRIFLEGPPTKSKYWLCRESFVVRGAIEIRFPQARAGFSLYFVSRTREQRDIYIIPERRSKSMSSSTGKAHDQERPRRGDEEDDQ